MVDATKGLGEEELVKKRREVLDSQKDERAALAKQRGPRHEELDKLVPGSKRISYLWLYENRTVTPGRQ